jgi:hypothetical protein
MKRHLQKKHYTFMKITPRFIASAIACCVLGLALTPRATAAVSDEDFNALKKMVQDMNQQMQQMQQTHQQDQQKIQQLQQQVGDTQTLATNAVEKADAVAQAQMAPTRNALHNFTMVGDAEIAYAKTYGNNTHNGFFLADFAPIFLFQANDRILFEAGFDVTVNNASSTGNYFHSPANSYTHDNGSETSVSMSFGQLDYLVNDYVTFVGGYMLLPLGTYSERTAGWLNKIPDDPLGVDLLQGAGAGVQLRGGIPIGYSGQSLSYAVYCANGPSSVDGTGNAYTLDSDGNKISNLDLGGNVGIQNDGNNGNLHSSPAGGGRVGWFVPWGSDHKDFEIGVSGQGGSWDDKSSYNWSAGVFDYAVHFGPYIEIKGEYINSWYATADAGNIHTWATWTQAGYKLAGLNLDLPFINDIELIGRYDRENNGLSGDPQLKLQRYTIGYVYYLTNTLLFEGDYEFIDNLGTSQQPSNFMVFQVSYGF